MDNTHAYLRRAIQEDVDFYFKWINDDSVRKNSFCTEKVSYDEHKNWFLKKLESESTYLYVYIVENCIIGQVRIDLDDGLGYIDYSIERQYRASGHGKRMLKLVEEKLIDDACPVTKLISKVKEENIASQIIFEKLNYKKHYIQYMKEIPDRKEIIFDEIENCSGGIFYLTNNRNTLDLFQWIQTTYNKELILYSEKLFLCQLENTNPSLIISYNYNYMITEDIIEFMQGRVINLHISFLPWNRGFSPNVWSFIDNTPKGVSIHLVDVGLDSGDILFQKEMEFNAEHETFFSTYEKLNAEIKNLFKQNWNNIIGEMYVPRKQTGLGSYHNKKNLEQLQQSTGLVWDETIADFLERISALNDKKRIKRERGGGK